MDTYTSEFEKSPQVDYYLQDKYKQSATERQEQFRKRVSIQDAVGENVPMAIAKRPVANPAKPPVQDQDDADGLVGQGILLAFLITLSLVVFLRLLFPQLFKSLVARLNPWAGDARIKLQGTAKVRAEDEAFTQFLTSFQAGPALAPGASAMSGGVFATSDDARSESQTKIERLLGVQRSLLQDVTRSAEPIAQRRALADLGREIQTFKDAVSSPELLPAWQLASALEGLLKQLSDKAGNVTRSTLRTVEGALELMDKLCRPGVNGNSLTNPPARFLAVDDDMICRTAISMALKKAFNQPDLADNPASALSMATRHSYDVIFLDVQMQGMDGFELCTKIHETTANQHTPVVFVTCLSDFDAYAQSVLNGGTDLMGKPFLTFEITVKALTLAFARRLDAQQPAKGQTAFQNKTKTADTTTSAKGSTKTFADTDRQSDAICHSTTAPANPELTISTKSARHVGILHEHIRQMAVAVDGDTRQEALADFYLALHAFTPRIDAAETHPAMRLCAALEGLLKKLLESPQNWTSSALLTISHAVDLLDDICDLAVDPSSETAPSLRLLVVDDDLISRRAIAGTVQTAFGKPESAENGEAAVALANEKTFDLIFMDVQMPGMDGFTACTRIRETELNRSTPVVFISGQADFATRVESATRGGNDLIAKPFLTSEVTLKALTFALRTRHQQISRANLREQLSSATVKQPVRESKRARKRRRAQLAQQRITSQR